MEGMEGMGYMFPKETEGKKEWAQYTKRREKEEQNSGPYICKTLNDFYESSTVPKEMKKIVRVVESEIGVEELRGTFSLMLSILSHITGKHYSMNPIKYTLPNVPQLPRDKCTEDLKV
eukprot:CAMPEP_0119153756 /NCGR_PEP_ID=MMETSP1310-20130426/49735_1 /TAXON_ID=464262 /ORGANISM="Genus nov. species nov., Strain RCC2339" /LENGTH=117 /DNA_ID=CAMNT_0007146229 /DNA_START=11 /DNA_END=360 /DNA_ORIENTATION=-